MSIIRVNKTSNYTVMSNEHLRDKRLSLKAKGLMSQMLSLPDDWDYSVTGLVKINKESRNAIETALRELKDNGYLVITKLTPDKTDSGRFEYEYDLYEVPQEQEAKKQEVENLPLEILPLENQQQINKEKQNTNKQNKDNISVISKEQDEYLQILLSVDYIAESEELQVAFMDFIEMRKKIKKPMTIRALRMIIKRTLMLSGGNIDEMIGIIEQSIRNDWQDVYPLKDEKSQYQCIVNKRATANPFTSLLESEI